MEMHGLVEVLFRTPHRAVLATVMEVEGHAYRKAGASMLLLENGSRYGSISPGCLESDLSDRVEGLLRSGGAEMVEYDMRPADDFSWGEAIGCGGMIRVLLEPVHGMLLHVLLEVKRRLDRGQEAGLLRSFVSSYTQAEYKLTEGEPNAAGDAAVLKMEDGVLRLVSSYTPRPRLLLFGASDDAVPVAELAQKSGFRVTVADWREGLCTSLRFPRASRVIGQPERIVERLQLTERDYVLIMSHHYPHDAKLLELLLPNQYKYVGVMGSISRTERLLGGRPAPDWLHYPVGLAIRAAGPEEIAISIAAQLIEVRRKSTEPRTEEWKGCESNGYLSRGRRGHKNGRFQAFHPPGRHWKIRRLRP
ncbi:XdhC family protein [Paenibacillus mucilaginosus]|uniref:Putative xanthine dehydrogenase n=1 Tax=Paenibacillus mucilaginosus (strain KNP414) TaxID=1036673 RepID=F8FDB6_PAEMK|nr:XdhC/CoxI family protein [Paenibacillus mucilaginosus]AEI41776.1 putative xanthine dehydrogenase [Paenibacillus mucilaginosus KNP414]MCG7214461.1 XdhC family protein [Paenibacillus mucilaginosus]WDM30743.1 XdhC family protein [Paenibacillus mucilaginosus]